MRRGITAYVKGCHIRKVILDYSCVTCGNTTSQSVEGGGAFASIFEFGGFFYHFVVFPLGG